MSKTIYKNLVVVLYDLDENGEAIASHFYCSDKCRSTVGHQYEQEGETFDCIAGTQCEACGEKIEAEYVGE
jgi:hypothetical protein